MKLTPAKELWALCRQLTRAKYGNTCFTCGKLNLSGSDWQTGHFIAKSICSTELAYDLKNLRPQCAACNIWKSGNWLAFESHLIEEEGQGYVDELKTRNRATKGKSFGTYWLKQRIGDYKLLQET